MPNYETLSKSKTWMSAIRLVKHIEIGNFPVILYRIAKNLMRRGHGKDLLQLNPLQTIGQKGEIH